ncbi:MAG: 2-oxoglutarate dehydrogenase E1 component [Bacteriovoracales bacterium]|nr:2-oxoglutarate dehydrogenase E1 component [Bacteriovoracales bacterium]
MDLSFLINSDGHYIDSLYQSFLLDPSSVDETWREFFQHNGELPKSSSVSTPLPLSSPKNGAAPETVDRPLEAKIQKLVDAYRERGHLASQTNPVRLRRDLDGGLELFDFGLTEQDLDLSVEASSSLGPKTLGELTQLLKSIYMGPLGFEYSHITSRKKRDWLQRQIESTAYPLNFSVQKKKRIFSKLKKATLFEQFLGTKYIGQKRFSLEGGEATIPAIDAIISEAARNGVIEVVIGMAHRGRLNILSNIVGKSYEYIFSEFEGIEKSKKVTVRGDGDVKYHLGFKTHTETTDGHPIVLKLMPNPSHLEAVAPVVEGYARAKGDATFFEGLQGHPLKILPLVIHGDAALSSQGVVYETAQMSKLEGYSTGGTIHFVINNQIGFTTDFNEGRSSTYCTDIAKVTDSPVFHVNGDDVHAVVYAAELAVKYRQEFGEDVYIDMVCYRKYGHNESDEPKYTQPDLYHLIQKHPSTHSLYTKKIVEEGVMSLEEAKESEKKFKEELQGRLDLVRNDKAALEEEVPDEEWVSFSKHRPKDFDRSPETGVDLKKLEQVHRALSSLPGHVKPIKKALKLIEDRTQKWQKGRIDWALAELYAYGSLLLEGHDIRLSGQDCVRGTFGHRHAGVFDEQSAKRYIGLNHIHPGQGKMEVLNSPLSEYAIMAFEYGYSLARPEALTIWEAQFGDFSNTAQTVVDQFISSAESKWNLANGIMLFLPHGYEGQGPEHSSARPERYLHLCAEFNMIVANCTTPANFFHLIRRQLKYPFRIPTVVFTPKSLLRHPECLSNVEALVSGKFEEFIDDEFCEKKRVKKVFLCSGKVFYDLQKKQRDDDRKDVAIVRLEQLHPLPFETIQKILNQYQKAQIVWVQEEPKNMGFWNYITRKFDHLSPEVVSRKSSASTATGYMSLHIEEQKEIIEKAFAL